MKSKMPGKDDLRTDSTQRTKYCAKKRAEECEFYLIIAAAYIGGFLGSFLTLLVLNSLGVIWQRVEALRDLIYDYRSQARQGREFHRRYIAPGRYIAPAATMLTGGRELCPGCGMEVRSMWRHCAWCGQRITAGGTRNRRDGA